MMIILGYSQGQTQKELKYLPHSHGTTAIEPTCVDDIVKFSDQKYISVNYLTLS